MGNISDCAASAQGKNPKKIGAEGSGSRTAAIERSAETLWCPRNDKDLQVMQQEHLASWFHPELNLSVENGVMRIGPIRGKVAESFGSILRSLEMTTGADDAIRVVHQRRGQAYLIVSGEAVTGYFMEDFGTSAPIESLDQLVLNCCQENVPVAIEGHYHPDDETRITTVMTAVHDGSKVSWAYRVTRLRSGEQLRLTSCQDRFPVIDCMPSIGVKRTNDALLVEASMA